MGQLFAYSMLKKMDNYKTLTPKKGCIRLPEVVVHEGFQLQGFYREILVFGINGRLWEVVAHGGLTVLIFFVYPQQYL